MCEEMANANSSSLVGVPQSQINGCGEPCMTPGGRHSIIISIEDALIKEIVQKSIVTSGGLRRHTVA